MSRPALYIAITSHGFGHAVRAASVAAAIQERCPEILLILVTTVPRWLLETYIPGDFIHRPRALDVGVIQSDSLTMDLEGTLEKVQKVRSDARSIIAGEVNFIRTNRVGLILADIPPLAANIASSAAIPCWMMSNFGWDFIYRDWGGKFIEIADWISECYGMCDRLFRLPFHEPMSAFPNIVDAGLTGGTPRHTTQQLQEKFGLTTPISKTVLLTFGGLSLQQIPYNTLTQFPDWQFITFDDQAPDLPNLLKVSGKTYRPVEFMPLCGRVISKPGYSTFAEAIRLGTPIVSITREGFAEASLLLDGLQNYAEHQILTPAEFFQSNWEFLDEAMQPPRKADSLAINGTEAIAQSIINYFQT
ncbi:MAG: glycosyl transferase [Cyanobacteriota bacterium]|nr:glycosyl transferase [Cyanobacteriota bacterium]